jgi:uncharacterized protein YjbJ (UPF0337 family)
MTETTELTRSGLIGKVAGSAKEFAGELTGNDGLARAGRHQQARSEGRLAEEGDGRLAEDRFVVEVENEMLENDLDEAEAEPAYEGDRAQSQKAA